MARATHPALQSQRLNSHQVIKIYLLQLIYFINKNTNKMQKSQRNMVTPLIAKTGQQTHQESHIQSGEYLKSLVYGGLDGSINTLIIILSGVASGTSASTILGFCIAAIVGDGLGMGLGDYLSARSEIGYIKKQEERQLYEIEHLYNDQIKEIIDIYLKKDFTLEQANRIAELYATNTQAFVNIMMLEQLGLVVVDESVALKCGIVTLISFMVFGALPSVPYIISSGILSLDTQQEIAVIVIGAVELFVLGFAKASLIGLNPWKSGMETLILGSAIVGIAYGIGIVLK